MPPSNTNSTIEINHEYQYTTPGNDSNGTHEHPTDDQMKQFEQDGYAIFPQVFAQDTVDALNLRLEHVLRGEYDTGIRPDKTPKLIRIKMPLTKDVEDKHKKHKNTSDSMTDKTKQMKFALGYSGNKRKKVFQIINIHKSDHLFRDLVTCPLLGMLVAKLMHWEDGARLIQDQIWAKPPGAAPLAFHRDSPYFMFDPSPVATVWIALDDMRDELGPLTYVKGSHRWGDGRVGSSRNFFQDDGGTALLFSAAEKEGLDVGNLEYESMNHLLAGGISIHDGRTWHGSAGNESNMPRRGIGLHFVPVNVRWTKDALKSSLWRKYVEEFIESGDDDDVSIDDIELDDDIFPVTWTPPPSP